MSLRSFFIALIAAVSASAIASVAAHAKPRVVVSIKPVHSLVTAVMAGIDEPTLIIDSGASPHGYRLKPSQASALSKADLVFWVGPELETFLEKPIHQLANKATAVALIDSGGIEILDTRSDHEDHGHKHSHDHGDHDPHIWLDPVNAALMVNTITGALIAKDPVNTAQYQRNADALSKDLQQFTQESEKKLSAIKNQAFLVFHDSYQYFEKRFGLKSLGAIVGNPDVPASARRVSEMRKKLRSQSGLTCVFGEPQFNDQLARTVASAGNATVASLDPLGANIPAGPDHYLKTMTQLREALIGCLVSVR